MVPTFEMTDLRSYLVIILVFCVIGWRNCLANAELGPTVSIELKRLDAESPSGWVLSLEYALAHGFNDIHLENNRFRRVAREVVYITPSTEKNKPRYLVTEESTSILDRIRFLSLFANKKITVFDRKTEKTILNWPAPVGGWPGDKTAKRLAELVNVPSEPDLNALILNDRAISKVIENTNSSVLTSTELNQLSAYSSCNGKIELAFDGNQYFRSIVSSNWQLLLPRDFNGMLCTDKGVFISSAWQPEDLDLIWLAYDGTLKMSVYVKANRTKLGGEHYPSTIVSAHAKGDQLVVRRAFFKQSNSINEWALDKEIEYIIPLFDSNNQLNRTP